MMAPDSVGAVGGATAPSDTTSTTTTSTSSTTTAAAKKRGGAFDDALKVARGVSSQPAPGPGTASPQAIARAQQLGIEGGVAAYDVLGRGYARLEGGSVNGLFVNTSGNARNGQMFERVERDGFTFHVYGDKAVRVDKPKS